MGRTIRLLVADDHAIVREGLCRLLTTQDSLKVCAEAENGRDAVEKALSLRPDIVLMDLAMPEVNGIDATRQIKKEAPQIKILILTAHEDKNFVQRALKAGADGYLLKNSDRKKLAEAINSVRKDGVFFEPEMVREEPSPAPPSTQDIAMLTRREREIFSLVAQGMKNRQISEKLCISVKTVEKHRSNLMKKLGLHSVAELVSCALQADLSLPPDDLG